MSGFDGDGVAANLGGVRPRVPAFEGAVSGVNSPRADGADVPTEDEPATSTGAGLLLNSRLNAAPTEEERFSAPLRVSSLSWIGVISG